MFSQKYQPPEAKSIRILVISAIDVFSLALLFFLFSVWVFLAVLILAWEEFVIELLLVKLSFSDSSLSDWAESEFESSSLFISSPAETQ